MIINYLMERFRDKRRVYIEDKYCIYYRNKHQRCELCKGICKNDAINIDNNGIRIIEDICKKCGLCSSICPSHAIRTEGFNDKNYVKEVKDKETCIISCSTKQENTGDIKFSCLSSLHREYIATILIILKEKKIKFNISKCKDCMVDKNCSHFRNSLISSTILLNDLGIDSNVELIANESKLYNDNDIEESISRKEFLFLMKNETTSIAKDLTVDILDNILNLNNNDIINNREMLIISIKNYAKNKLIKDEFKSSMFTSWGIRDNCNGCGLCKAICPWGAWDIKESEKNLVVSHNLRLCKSCRLCIDLCPNKCICEDKVYLNMLYEDFDEKIIIDKAKLHKE